MKKEEISKEFKRFQNITTNIKISMLLDDKNIKALDEGEFEDVKEIDFEENVEFGIFYEKDKIKITFEVGVMVIDKNDFEETLKKCYDRKKFIGKLKNMEQV